ncbi:inositol monophosphatase family protein, partial [Pseudomonadota bacterium]
MTGIVELQNIKAQQLAELTEFAEYLANVARESILPYFRTKLDVEHKSDKSPVTAIDRNTETKIREAIAATYPDHGILGEEHGASKANHEFVWVIDPIDGTKNFLCGIPLFGSLISLTKAQMPVVGVIDLPGLKERWVGAIGQRTTQNSKPCRTSDCQLISRAKIGATSIDLFVGEDLDRFNHVSSEARFRCFGGDCSLYAHLASGYLDLVIEADLKPYDFFALIPVVEGAGGKITDWHGKALDFKSDGRI